MGGLYTHLTDPGLSICIQHRIQDKIKCPSGGNEQLCALFPVGNLSMALFSRGDLKVQYSTLGKRKPHHKSAISSRGLAHFGLGHEFFYKFHRTGALLYLYGCNRCT